MILRKNNGCRILLKNQPDSFLALSAGNWEPQNMAADATSPLQSNTGMAPASGIQNKTLKVGHIDIRILLLKIEGTRHILVGQLIDILSITFISDPILDSQILVLRKTVHRNDRGSLHGAGATLYVRSNLSHEQCSGVNTNTEAEVCRTLNPQSLERCKDHPHRIRTTPTHYWTQR